MPLKNWIRSAVTGIMLERPAQKMTLPELADKLDTAGQEIAQRAASADDTPDNREQLRHIIGIERWGQSRLRVALGGPLAEDTSDAYRPADEMPWLDLQEEFQIARRDTIALARELAEIEIDPTLTIPHEEYGKLTVFGWLRYLDVHSSLESKRIL
jgi:hypothetical protein